MGAIMQTFDVAVLGATGVVGETILTILEKRKFPVGKLYPLASENSSGATVMFRNKPIQVLNAADFDFTKVQLAFFTAGEKASRQFASKARDSGCVVIDNTAAFRNDAGVPLIIPEVNPNALAGYKDNKIIANPNCTTIQMLVAIKPIYDRVGIKRIDVATYQSVSGSGRAAISELASQTTNLLNARSIEPAVYPCQIAFNLIPQIDEFQDNGFTKEEMKMIWETQKILADPSIVINPTNVRVPVFYGHSAAIHLVMSDKLTAREAKNILRSAYPGVLEIMDIDEQAADNEESVPHRYPTPVTHASGSDKVYIGRIRNGYGDDRVLNMWVVSDNIRKGAALNSVQIAEMLLKTYF